MIKNGWIVSDGLMIDNKEVVALKYADGNDNAPATLTLTLRSGATFTLDDEAAIAVWGEYMKKMDGSDFSAGRRSIR